MKRLDWYIDRSGSNEEIPFVTGIGVEGKRWVTSGFLLVVHPGISVVTWGRLVARSLGVAGGPLDDSKQ
jgi:hypothetical protein